MAVNPNVDMVEGDRCYAGLGALPEKPDGVVVVVAPNDALKVINEVAALGIRNHWLQQGASSRETDQKCVALNLNCVSGECIFMYLEPVKSVHAYHRFFRRMFGKMPKRQSDRATGYFSYPYLRSLCFKFIAGLNEFLQFGAFLFHHRSGGFGGKVTGEELLEAFDLRVDSLQFLLQALGVLRAVHLLCEIEEDFDP